MAQLYSVDTPGIKQASACLLLENADHLIRFIYANTDRPPYDKPELRVGLSIKILIKSSNQGYSGDLLDPVLADLQELLTNEEYLKQFKDPIARREALSKELSLINKFKELDETISLNTMHGMQGLLG